MPSEEMALLGALGRFGMGIRHCDGNTRQCMATAVVAYKQAFGSGCCITAKRFGAHSLVFEFVDISQAVPTSMHMCVLRTRNCSADHGVWSKNGCASCDTAEQAKQLFR